MKKILISVIIMILLLFSTYEILSESNTIINCVSYSFEIWINNLFPSMFPFFVLSDLLINYGLVEFISELFKPIFTYLFKTSKNSSFIFIMSMISGFPSNAKYTKELYLQNKIDEKEASKILMFSHFSNPLFILGTISISFLNNRKLGLIVLISHYISNVIIGLLVRNYNKSAEKEKFSIKKAILDMHNKRINNKNFGIVFTNAILNSINTLLLILGVITTFLIISTIIDNNLHPNLYIKTIISSILEMTQGLKWASLLNISEFYKTIIITMILSFGGLSVHTQIISIISDTKIKYTPFLIARILHVIISFILCIILLKCFY